MVVLSMCSSGRGLPKDRAVKQPLCSPRGGQSIQKFEDEVQEHTEKVLLSRPSPLHSNSEAAKGKCCVPQVIREEHEVVPLGRRPDDVDAVQPG